MSPFPKWGLTVPVVVAALAVAYRLQQPVLSPEDSSSVTYCYSSIRTHHSDNPRAECFSVTNGVFTAVGSQHDDASVIDGHVIPGLWDGHGHLLQYGEFLHSVDLFGAESLDDVRSRIRAYLARNPGAGTKDNWVRGVGWDQTFFGHMPTAVSFV